MAPTSWVILYREATASADLPQGVALSLALAPPPRVTTVALHTSVCPLQPDPTARRMSPFVVAADPSGLLLLLTPPPLSERDDGELRSVRGPDGVERSVRVPSPRFVVCDVSSSSAASPFPYPDGGIYNNLGVIAAPGGGGRFMVVQFQHIGGGREATLHCFSSETRGWVEKDVVNPLPRWFWTFSDVVAHGGRLWWVDKVAGIIGFDPFPDDPTMEYVRLPRGDVQQAHGCGCCSERALGSRRLVQLSDGAFRCVEMACASHGGAAKVSMRTLADPAASEWTLEYEASFSEIWAADSYKATGLPQEEPLLALVHPRDPHIVYFFLEQRLFGVDMRAREVVGCESFEPQIYGGFFSWLVLPFELPDMSPHEFMQGLTKRTPSFCNLSLLDFDGESAAEIGVCLSRLASQISMVNSQITLGAEYINHILPYMDYVVGLLGNGTLGVPAMGTLAFLKQLCTVAGRTAGGLSIAERAASVAGFQLQLMRPGAQSGCRAPRLREIVLVSTVEEAIDAIEKWRETHVMVLVEVPEDMGKELAIEIYQQFFKSRALKLIEGSDVLLSKIRDEDDSEYVFG